MPLAIIAEEEKILRGFFSPRTKPYPAQGRPSYVDIEMLCIISINDVEA